jgi:hypothetical protein
MVDQARGTLAKLRQMQPPAATLKEIADEVATASFAQPASSPAVEVSIEEEVPEVVDATSSQLAGGWPTVPAAEPEPATLSDFVADLESSLGDSFLPSKTSKPAAAPAQMAGAQAGAKREAPEARMAAGAAAAFAGGSTGVSPAFPSGPGPLPPTLAPQSHPAAPVPEAPPTQPLGMDLSDMLGDLRQELEAEDTSAAVTEDCETHYNLGVAFREMGLLDEAIGELQKVCQAVERGQQFPQLMQTYTWLAQCFLDKGVPEAAVRWYEKALQIPSLDAESRMAVHYEIGCAHEAGQNKPAALKHFLDVYGTNIDYRDVAERIKALKS